MRAWYFFFSYKDFLRDLKAPWLQVRLCKYVEDRVGQRKFVSLAFSRIGDFFFRKGLVQK